MVEPQTVRELLSVLVPLVAEGCAFDTIAFDGTRSRVAAVHQNRAEEEALASSPVRSSRARTVSVFVANAKIGEVVVWRHAAMNAVEEALVVTTAERIADEIEKSTMRSEPAEAAAIADMVGHELRGPLQAIGLGLELLRTRVRDSADEVSREWLLVRIGGLERASKRLGDVADRVAEMSRPIAGNAPVREKLELDEVVTNVLARMHDEIAWAECTVTVLRGAASLDGWWDRIQLETVVGNLLANAIKFGAKAPIEVSLDGTAEDVVLRVRDHGCGIDSADLPYVFERFYRGATPSALPGLGLGLALVDGLVRAHRGEVTVESVRGEGATFGFRLPRGVTAAEARKPASSRREAPSP